MTDQRLQIEHVPIDRLRAHPRNYRSHPADQLDHIQQSLREHGFYRNVIVARDDTVLAGHGVVQAARALGIDHVPVVRLDLDPDSPRALKVLTADNEVSHLAVDDDRLLTELLRSIRDEDEAGLLGTGYDDAMLAGLVLATRPREEIPDNDSAQQWVGMPEYQETGHHADSVFLTIRFVDRTDRDAFMAQQSALPGGDRFSMVKRVGEGVAWSTSWPSEGNADNTSVRFEDEDDA